MARFSWLLIPLLMALCVPAQALAAGIEDRQLKAARAFLETESRINDMIAVMHSGTTPIRGTFHKCYLVTYTAGRPVAGHFVIEMRYRWRGPLTRDGETDVQFSFNEKGRLYDFEVVRTNGYAFLVTRAQLELGRLAVRCVVRGEKNAADIIDVANSIKTVRGLHLLRLQMEQLVGK